MFGKLLKYEFKSISKWYLGLLAVTCLVAIATGSYFKVFLSNVEDSNVIYEMGRFSASQVSFIMSLIVLGGLLMSVTIASYIIVIRRFYLSVYSRQGYLTMTLPVTTHAIILSKLLVAALLFAASYIIFSLVAIAFVIPSIGWTDTFLLFKGLLFDILPLVNPFWTGLWITNTFLSNLSGVLVIYLAISIGQLFNSYRILMGFVSYGIIIVLLSLFTLLVTTTFSDTGIILANTIMTLTIFVISYIATHTIMKYKLNLE